MNVYSYFIIILLIVGFIRQGMFLRQGIKNKNSGQIKHSLLILFLMVLLGVFLLWVSNK